MDKAISYLGFENYIKNPVTPMSIATTNAIKRSAIAVHLINNPVCGNNYNESSFSILRKCFNYFDD